MRIKLNQWHNIYKNNGNNPIDTRRVGLIDEIVLDGLVAVVVHEWPTSELIRYDNMSYDEVLVTALLIML